MASALAAKNGRVAAALLIALSIAWLPLDLYLLAASYVLQQLLYVRRQSGLAAASLATTLRGGSSTGSSQRSRPPQPAVLITGVSTAQGLAVARAFRRTRCRVIAADPTPMSRLPIPWWRPAVRLLPPGALSAAVTTYHSLPPVGGPPGGLAKALVRVVKAEKVALWIDCSPPFGSAEFDAAMALVAKTTECRPVALSGAVAETLRDRDAALRWVGDELGLQVPQTHTVRSRDQVHRVLNGGHQQQARGKPTKPYTLQPASPEGKKRAERPVRLPKRTVSETYETLAGLQLTQDSPYVLTQEVVGRRYRAAALVVRNEVLAFAAHEAPPPGSPTWAGIEALPPDSAIAAAMLKYAQTFAARCSQRLTGHVALDFAVEERSTEAGTTGALYATAVHAGGTPALALLAGRERDLAACYLQVCAESDIKANGGDAQAERQVLVPAGRVGVFWAGYDVMHLVVAVLGLPVGRTSLRECLRGAEQLNKRLAGRRWRDAMAAVNDPLPAFWMYHVFWPMRLAGRFWGRQSGWGSIDLSAGEWAG